MSGLERNVILTGEAGTRLRELPAASVDCVITSPPYVGLRNYHHPEQIGAELSVEVWIDRLQVVMREVSGC